MVVSGMALNAVMGGGDDTVFGSQHDDIIDGGDGVDTVYPFEGQDTCISVEHVRGGVCEPSSEPADRGRAAELIDIPTVTPWWSLPPDTS